ncbi:O-antigen ligase family protein [Spirosoma aerophilum]
MYFLIFAITISLLQVNSYSDSVLVKVLPLGASALAFFYFLSLSNGKLLLKSLGNNLLAFTLLIFVLIGNFRSNYPDQTLEFTISRTLNTILLFGALFSAIHYFRNTERLGTIDIIIKFIITPFFIYCLINFLLWAMGVSIKESVMTDEVVNKEAVILSYLGIHIDRVQFPLSTGLNNYAVIIGAMFTTCLLLIFVVKVRSSRLFIMSSCIVFFITLLLIDSRASIYYPIIITIVFGLYQNSRTFLKLIPYSPTLVVLGPLFLYLMVPLLMSLPFIDSLTRNSEELATGNSRFLIWSACLLEFIDFKPIHLIGYGYFGHYGSGVSSAWASIFSTWNDEELKTSHNTFFTILFDYGYVGLFVYCALIYNTVKKISLQWKVNKYGNLLIFGFFAFNLLAGITETLIGFYSPNYFILFFLFLFANFFGNSPILVEQNNFYRFVNVKQNKKPQVPSNLNSVVC